MTPTHWVRACLRSLGTARPRRPRSRLELEQLEDRTVPSAAQLVAPPLMQPTYDALPAATRALDATQSPPGLTPVQIRGAYGFDHVAFPGNVPADGRGQTIAIVDAYDDPTAAADLLAFDRQFALPAASFVKVGLDATGRASTTHLPSPDRDWSVEIGLDVEWAHAIAPAASILLVEAHSNSYADLLRAVDFARRVPGVSAVSMSWGSGEFRGETAFDAYFTTPAGHAGVTFLASSGDGGAPALFPSVSAHVVSVGGTSLQVDPTNEWLDESGWAGGGGGISRFVRQPAYQKSLAIFSGGMRTAPDVAYDADPNTGVAVLATYGYGGWLQVGGTSAGAPQWAALVALANQGRALAGEASLDGFTQTLPRLYRLPASDFHDIWTGDNGFVASAGYDLVTGLGSPVTDALIPDLIDVSPVMTSLVVTPGTPAVGDGDSFALTAVALDQYGRPMRVQPNLSWSLAGGAGTLTSAGLYTAPSSGSGSDMVTVTATLGGVTLLTTVTVTYEPGPSITQLVDPGVVTGVATTLVAEVAAPDPTSLRFAWWLADGPAGAATPTLASPSSDVTAVSFFQAGAYRFSFSVTDAVGVRATGSLLVTVVPTATGLVMTPATVTIADGATRIFVANVVDQFGQPLAEQPTIAWSLTGLGTIDAGGVYQAPATGSGTDTISVSASVAGATLTGTATVTYLPGLAVMSIDASPREVTGTTTTLSATVADPGDGEVSCFWGVLSAPDDVGPLFDDPESTTTKATFFQPGEYILELFAFDLSGGFTTATVTVDVTSTVTNILVSPLAANIPDGGQQLFTAQALDQFYEPMSASFTWSIARGPGSIDANGLYTAPATGIAVTYVQADTIVNGVAAHGLGFALLREPPTVTAIGAAPNSPATAMLSVAAADPNGAALSYRWTTLAAPVGAAPPSFAAGDAAGTQVHVSRAGSYVFQVAVTDSVGMKTLATVAWTVDPILTSVVAPVRVNVHDGTPQSLVAAALDQFGQPMPAVLTWSLVTGRGTIDAATGVYTPPNSGSGTILLRVSASSAGVMRSHTTIVTLLPPLAPRARGAARLAAPPRVP